MDRFWSLASRPAFYQEAFQSQFKASKAPSKDLLQKLNAVSLTGPMGNQEYFRGLMRDVLGTTAPVIRAEGFQGTSTATATATPTLDQMITYIDVSGSGTPETFQTAPGITTLSQIDQLETFYLNAESARTDLLTQIRDYIWNQISTFQTIVSNVSSIRDISGDEVTVNEYAETEIQSMNEGDLVTTWNTYISAKDTLLDSGANRVDTVLTAQQSLYDRLYSTYQRFRGLQSVSDISDKLNDLSGSTVQAIPTLVSLQASNYAIVNSYFAVNGYLDGLITFVRTNLGAWEDDYFSVYNALPSNIKTTMPYTDMNFSSKTAEQLISAMNSFGGVAPIETTGPAPAPTGDITKLITGTFQEQAIKAVRAFYKLIVENLVVFTDIADVTGNTVSISVASKQYSYKDVTITTDATTTTIKTLLSGITSTLDSLAQTVTADALSTNDQKAIATIRAKYEEGKLAAFEQIKTAFRTRLDEYNTLYNMQEFFKNDDGTLPSDAAFTKLKALPANTTAQNKTDISGFTVDSQGTLPELRYRYFITEYKQLVDAYVPVYEYIKNITKTIYDTTTVLTTEERPDYPTVAAPTLSGTNPGTFDLSGLSMKAPTACVDVSGSKCTISQIVPDMDASGNTFNEFYGTYMNARATGNATVYPIYDLRKVIVTLSTSLLDQFNYYGNIQHKIFKKMYDTMYDILDNYNVVNNLETTLITPEDWVDNPDIAEVSRKFKSQNSAFVDYKDMLTGKIKAALKAYSDLYSNYSKFRSSALAPSTNLASTSLIDDSIAEIPFPERDSTVDTLESVTADQTDNTLFRLAKKYGIDGIAISYDTYDTTQNLLPQLIDLTKSEVSDYIGKYASRFQSLAPSTRTLGTSAPTAADQSALSGTAVTAQAILDKMSNYGTYSTGVLEAVDRDMVLDRLDDFNDMYLRNKNIMEAVDATTYTVLKGKFETLGSTTFSTSTSISATIESKVSADIDVFLAEQPTYNITTITSAYNLYDGSITAMNSSLMSDISGIRANIVALNSAYRTFYSNYSDFFSLFSDKSSGLTFTNLAQYTTAIPATIDGANTQIAYTDTKQMVSDVKSNLKSFVQYIDEVVGKENYLKYNDVPSTSNISTEDRGNLNEVLPSFDNTGILTNADKLSAFCAASKNYTGKLKSLKTCIDNLDSFMVSIKTSFKTGIQNKIGEFLGYYDKSLREALKAPGSPNENRLAATIVCQKPTGNSATISCNDTSTSIDDENYDTTSTENYSQGYPFIDSAFLNSDSTNIISITDLNSYFTKYKDLITDISNLSKKLLGLTALRPIMVGYIQTYYDTYSNNKYKDIIEVAKVQALQVYADFKADVSGAKQYFPQIESSGYSTQSASFNNLTEDQLNNTFLPYATADSTATPPRIEGFKYRTLLKLMASAVINVIVDFEDKRTLNDDIIQARFSSLSDTIKDISYTVADKNTLDTSGVTLSTINQYYDKYLKSGGLNDLLETAISTGSASKKKRDAAIGAMRAFSDVYSAFNTRLFPDLPNSGKYSSPNLGSEFTSMLRKYNDTTNTVYYLDGSSRTQAFNDLSDPELDSLADKYYGAIPVTPTFNKDASGTVVYQTDYSVTKTDTLVGLIKSRLNAEIQTFKDEYDAAKDISGIVALWDNTTNAFVPSLFQTPAINDMIDEDKQKVTNAKSKSEIDYMVIKYLVTDNLETTGLKNQLSDVIKNIQTLRQKRDLAQASFILFTSILNAFPQDTLMKDLSSNELQFIDTYYNRSTSTVNQAFYGLSVGNDGDTLVLPTTAPTLNGIINYFNAENGAGVGALYTEIGSRIISIINDYKNNYFSAPSSSLFSNRFVTAGRLGAPSSQIYSESSLVTNRVNADISGVNTYVANRSTTGLQNLYEKYAGNGSIAGYQKELGDLIDSLTVGKQKRDLANEELVDCFNLAKPFVGSARTISALGFTVPSEVNLYINSTGTGVTDSFFDLSNAELERLDTKFGELSDTSVTSSPFSLTGIRSAPNLNADGASLIDAIRYYVFMLIKDVNTTYTNNKKYLDLPGVVLPDDIAVFTTTRDTDISGLHTANESSLANMQTKYFNLKDLIISTAGPLALTDSLRPKAVSAADAYLKLYDAYKPFADISGSSEYTNMILDYNYITSIYDANDTQSQLKLSVNNTLLECVRKKYVNPFDSIVYDSGVSGVSCDNSTINSDYANKTNAYTRLLKACAELVKTKIDSVVTYYTDNKNDIEENGREALDTRIRHILTIQPDTTNTEPNNDKQSITDTPNDQLETKLQNIMNKYYNNGQNSIMSLVQNAQFKGDELGSARRNMNSAISDFRSQYDLYNATGSIFDANIRRRNGTNYISFLSSNTNATSYISNMGPGTSETSSAYTYLDKNNRLKFTTAFKALSLPQLESEKVAFENLLKNTTGSYLSSVKSAVEQFIMDYKSAWDAETTLFGDVLGNADWDVNIKYPSLNPKVSDSETLSTDDDISVVSAITSLPSISLVNPSATNEVIPTAIIPKYLKLFSLLDSAITDATRQQVLYKCRDAMLKLYTLYDSFKNQIGKPARVTEAESYYDFATRSRTSNAGFKTTVADKSNLDIGVITTNIITAYTNLFANIKSTLKSLIESYQSLRKQFLEFYDENKESLGSIAFVESLNRTQVNNDDSKQLADLSGASTEAALITIRDYYIAGSPSLFNQMMTLVEDYFNGNTGAMAKYETSFDKLFGSAPPATGLATLTSQFARGSSETTERDLTSLKNTVSRYDARYDEVRLTNARVTAAQAILGYWESIGLMTPEIQAKELASALYIESRSYINMDTGSFTTTYMNLGGITNSVVNTSKYSEIQSKFSAKSSVLLTELKGQYETEVAEFSTLIWPKYMQYVGKTDVSIPMNIPFVGDMDWFKTHIGERGLNTTVIEIVANNMNATPYNGISPKEMFSRMQKFVKEFKLYLLALDYQMKIIKDATVSRNPQSDPYRYMFAKPATMEAFAIPQQASALDAFFTRPLQPQPQQNTAALEAFFTPTRYQQPQQFQTQQPQQPQPQQQPFQSGGTSRWSLF